MVIASNTFVSGSAVGNREDLTNIIYNISPTLTPFMSGIGITPVTNKLHEWQTDSLAAASTANASIEGNDITNASVTATTRAQNRTQISIKAIGVSGTQEAITHAGRDSEMAYLMKKASEEIKRDIESTITRNQGISAGSTSAGPKARTYCAWITTNDSRGATGTDGSSTGAAAGSGTQRALTEALLKDVLQKCYTAGGNPDTISANTVNRQKISGFGGNLTRFGDAATRELVSTIEMYVSDFGTLKVVCNRFQRERDVLVYDSSKWAMGYLRPFQNGKLAKTGDAEREFILAEWTLEARNEASSGIVADLTTS